MFELRDYIGFRVCVRGFGRVLTSYVFSLWCGFAEFSFWSFLQSGFVSGVFMSFLGAGL